MNRKLTSKTPLLRLNRSLLKRAALIACVVVIGVPSVLAQLTVTMSVSPSPAVYGQEVTVSAVVSSPTGDVPDGKLHFKGAVFGYVNGSAGSVSRSGMFPDNHGCVVNFLVNGRVAASGSTAVTVLQAPTTTTVVTSPNPSVWGQPVAITGTVKMSALAHSGGKLTYFSGADELGDRTLDKPELVALHLPVGTQVISATFGGNIPFSGSTGTITQVVNPAPTTTTISSSRSPSLEGQRVIIHAIVKMSSGTGSVDGGSVIFTNGDTLLAEVPVSPGGWASLVTADLPTGSDTITATYSGATNFTGSSASLTQVVQ